MKLLNRRQTLRADEALERLAEDGNFQPLLDKVSGMKGLTASGMFVQSNDLFFAPREGGIALFDAGGRAMHGNVTSRVALFDAGTEVAQPPGAGPRPGAAPGQAQYRQGGALADRSGNQLASAIRRSKP